MQDQNCDPMTCEGRCVMVMQHMQKYHSAMVTFDVLLLIGLIALIVIQCKMLKESRMR
jgi:hypothetical protein